ncbi:MAG: hypothetical protein U0531_14550 [Dehalococcoidia bacterium]
MELERPRPGAETQRKDSAMIRLAGARARRHPALRRQRGAAQRHQRLIRGEEPVFFILAVLVAPALLVAAGLCAVIAAVRRLRGRAGDHGAGIRPAR